MLLISATGGSPGKNALRLLLGGYEPRWLSKRTIRYHRSRLPASRWATRVRFLRVVKTVSERRRRNWKGIAPSGGQSMSGDLPRWTAKVGGMFPDGWRTQAQRRVSLPD